MSGYLLSGAVGIACVGLLVAGAQTARLSKTQGQLEQTEAKLAEVRVKLERANESRAAMETTLATERERAVAAEREAGSLREQITADAGTPRDAATAPVLLDVLRRLGGPKK